MKPIKRIGAAVMALVMLMSLCAVGGVSVSAMSGGGSAGTGSIHAWGCDMSYYNTKESTDFGLVDFAKMKADGCDYVILRVGYEAQATREDTLDTSFVTLYNMAREAGMGVGVYFYALAKTQDGAIQDAQWCIDIFEQYDMYFEYPIYYDVEDPGSDYYGRVSHASLSSAETTALCLGWAQTLEAAGYFPGVYAGMEIFNDLTSAYMDYYDTWIAFVKDAMVGSQYDPAASCTPYSPTGNPNNINFSTTYGAWQYKWYSYGGAQAYDGACWQDQNGYYPLDCNVSFKDYPTIMQTYGYNNMAARQTVTFESNGGSAVDPMKVVVGKGFTPPADPTRHGFTFAGWYADPALTDAYDFTAAVPEYDFTLYAKWEEAYWGANTDLMPKDGALGYRSYNEAGERLWAYWNADTGACSMYNGVTDGGWPSAYMLYENSVDMNSDSYIYFKKDGDAQFQAELTYMAANGELHSIKLSEILGLETTDFPAGYMEVFVDVRQYIIDQGHMPASGNLKYTQFDYYVIGGKDQFVTIYDMKFTPKFEVADPFVTMMNSSVQQLAGAGSYVYDNGVLTMNSTSAEGYSVKMPVDQTINPTEFANLLMDVSSTTDFNIAVELTNGNGDALMKLNTEFFDAFDLTTAPSALPAGTWSPLMNLYGYYEWNGGVVTESMIKSVTITLVGEGTLTLKALQASRTETVNYVADGAYSSGSLSADSDDYLLGDVDGNGEITTADARIILQYTIGSVTLTDKQIKAADFNGDGTITTADARDVLISTL